MHESNLFDSKPVSNVYSLEQSLTKGLCLYDRNNNIYLAAKKKIVEYLNKPIVMLMIIQNKKATRNIISQVLEEMIDELLTEGHQSFILNTSLIDLSKLQIDVFEESIFSNFTKYAQEILLPEYGKVLLVQNMPQVKRKKLKSYRAKEHQHETQMLIHAVHKHLDLPPYRVETVYSNVVKACFNLVPSYYGDTKHIVVNSISRSSYASVDSEAHTLNRICRHVKDVLEHTIITVDKKLFVSINDYNIKDILNKFNASLQHLTDTHYIIDLSSN